MAVLALCGTASVPVLIAALAANDRVVRERAAATLGGIGTGAGEAIPALTGALLDPSRWVQEAAATALAKIASAGGTQPDGGPVGQS